MFQKPLKLPGKFQGQRSLAGYSTKGHKESDTIEVTDHTCTKYWAIKRSRFLIYKKTQAHLEIISRGKETETENTCSVITCVVSSEKAEVICSVRNQKNSCLYKEHGPEMSYILIWQRYIAKWAYSFVKIRGIIHLRSVHFLVFKIYLILILVLPSWPGISKHDLSFMHCVFIARTILQKPKALNNLWFQ